MAQNANYTDIIANIKDKFSKKSSGFGSDTDASIRRWISEKEYDVYSERRWPFMQKTGSISTVASTQQYSLATDYAFGSIMSVYDATNLAFLTPITAESYDRVLPGTTTTGSPLYYYLWGTSSNLQQIFLYPIPSAVDTITYRYYKDPTPTDISTDQTNDSLSPILPQRYRSLLVDAVLEELLQKDANPNADRVNVKYQNMLAKMVADFGTQPNLTQVRRSADDVFLEIPIPQFPTNFPRGS